MLLSRLQISCQEIMGEVSNPSGFCSHQWNTCSTKWRTDQCTHLQSNKCHRCNVTQSDKNLCIYVFIYLSIFYIYYSSLVTVMPLTLNAVQTKRCCITTQKEIRHGSIFYSHDCILLLKIGQQKLIRNNYPLNKVETSSSQHHYQMELTDHTHTRGAGPSLFRDSGIWCPLWKKP